jgi:SAM-dependent methyltransferase
MGLWERHVVPRVINLCGNGEPVRRTRARVCAGLVGEVIEIGFGSGLNVPYYPQAVTKVWAVDPSETAWRLAQPRVQAASVPVEWRGTDAQSLPCAESSMDAALSTWTMCTIPDANAALHELRRVLKPGAPVFFIEHGLSPDVRVARWQNRLQPIQRRLAGGCHIDRPISELFLRAGFTFERLDTYYEKVAPKSLGYTYEGIALPEQ